MVGKKKKWLLLLTTTRYRTADALELIHDNLWGGNNACHTWQVTLFLLFGG
jgi:hypothetical protein